MDTSEEHHQEALPPLLYQLLLRQDQLLFPDDMYTSLLNDGHQNESLDLQYVFYGKEYNNVFAHSWKCNHKLHQMINVQSSQYNSQISLITHSNVPTRY